MARKSSRSKTGKAAKKGGAGKARAGGMAAKVKVGGKADKVKTRVKADESGVKVFSLPSTPSFAPMHDLKPLPEHIIKLLIPTSNPIPSSPPADSAASQKLSDEQTWQLLSLGQKCYSLIGQTRLFWSHLKPPLVDHEWLRFHFLQSSMLSTLFIALYALFGAGILLEAMGFGFAPFGIVEAAFVLVAILHFAAFFILGKKAARGEVPMVPFIGSHAALLAASGRPLDAWKL